MTLEEQRDIIQAAMQDDEIEFIAAQGSYDQEYYSILKGHKFNFFKYNYRIKPKEPEQPDIVKTEIKWEKTDGTGWFTKRPDNKEDLYQFKLCDISQGYILVGFYFNLPNGTTDVRSDPIWPEVMGEMFDKLEDAKFWKATHVIWERIK